MLTLARLKELLHYDPETGLWTWLVNRTGFGARAGDHPSHKDGNGYLQFSVDGRLYHSNRLAWFYMTGEWPPRIVDHEDLDRSNDRWRNLRLATVSQNKANGAVYANNDLGVKGVQEVRPGKFRARIQVLGKPKHIGYYGTAELANAAYAAEAIKHFGEFARS